MSIAQDVHDTMQAVRALERQLLTVLKTAPENIGVMAMARLLATTAIVKGHSAQKAADGVLLAYRMLQAEHARAKARS